MLNYYDLPYDLLHQWTTDKTQPVRFLLLWIFKNVLFIYLFFLKIFIWAFVPLCIGQLKSGQEQGRERGGMTCSKGPQVESNQCPLRRGHSLCIWSACSNDWATGRPHFKYLTEPRLSFNSYQGENDQLQFSAKANVTFQRIQGSLSISRAKKRLWKTKTTFKDILFQFTQ